MKAGFRPPPLDCDLRGWLHGGVRRSETDSCDESLGREGGIDTECSAIYQAGHRKETRCQEELDGCIVDDAPEE